MSMMYNINASIIKTSYFINKFQFIYIMLAFIKQTYNGARSHPNFKIVKDIWLFSDRKRLVIIGNPAHFRPEIESVTKLKTIFNTASCRLNYNIILSSYRFSRFNVNSTLSTSCIFSYKLFNKLIFILQFMHFISNKSFFLIKFLNLLVLSFKHVNMSYLSAFRYLKKHITLSLRTNKIIYLTYRNWFLL